MDVVITKRESSFYSPVLKTVSEFKCKLVDFRKVLKRETRQLIGQNKNYASENIILSSDHENYKPIEQMHTNSESSPYKNQHS